MQAEGIKNETTDIHSAEQTANVKDTCINIHKTKKKEKGKENDRYQKYKKLEY